jgi:hypothetical protein
VSAMSFGTSLNCSYLRFRHTCTKCKHIHVQDNNRQNVAIRWKG